MSAAHTEDRAFTLIELLVVIAVIALLIGILLPALGAARKNAKSTVCSSNLRGIGQGLVLYASDHKEQVVASYTMTGVSGAGVPLEGWGPILDQGGYLDGAGEQTLRRSPFTCPEALDVPGLLTGQTGNDPDNGRGWMDWPTVRNGSGFIHQPIPDRGFEKVVRVAYWINADNPIGGVANVVPDTFYTGSVGYGPGSNGVSITHTRMAAFVRPHALVAIADGVYAGRQRDNRIGTTNSRIGYRHPGVKVGAADKFSGSANAAFADGHVANIDGHKFPRSLGGTNVPKEVIDENANGQPSVYANPERSLGL